VTSGHSIGQVAKSCGLSASAIYKWRNDLRHSFRSEDRVRRLAIVPEHTKQSSASSLCHARIVVKGIVIEIDLDRLPDVIAALRELP
jgi:transposase-like protein